MTATEIREYSKRYNLRYANTPDFEVEQKLRDWFTSHRFLDKEHFLKLCCWKSKRPKKSYAKNSEELITEITRFSLSTKSEEARMKTLLILDGVAMPVASVILHFAFPDKYSILDFRAIWALGWEQPNKYTYDFWIRYCNQVKKLADGLGVSIRTIDKALWQYSKEKQK